MPKPNPVPSEKRDQIALEIQLGAGRNELARRHGVSPGLVSKIARERGLWFAGCEHTVTATRARQVDQWAARVRRAEQLEAELDEATATMKYDGTYNRRARRLSYAIYNLDRHHNGTHGTYFS